MSRRIPVIVLGTGKVGRAFVRQLLQNHRAIAARYDVDFHLICLADSSGALVDHAGIKPDLIEARLAAKAAGRAIADQPGTLSGQTPLDLIRHAAEPGMIVVDTTAADGMEPALSHTLAIGGGVVLANKRPVAGPWQTARVFFDSPRARYEATVGAGLPVIHTLRYLVDTGDAVRRIEGALSGTLAYLCSRLEEGEAFSTAVETAKAKGYTEPDPRDDLSGMDVARKALILARLAGWPLELADVHVDPLYPAEMASLSEAEFMAHLPRLNSDFAAYMGALAGVPRYLAEITPQGGTVGLRMVGERVATQLRGTLNQVSFFTDRYADHPLGLLGPGAGIDVTAAAVLQDCLQLAVSHY